MARGPAKKERPPLARWLRQVRTRNDLDQEEFAMHLGVSRSTITAYENGSRRIQPEVIAHVMTEFPGSPPAPTGNEVEILGRAVGEDRLAYIKYAGIVPCSSDWGDPLQSEDNRPIDPKFAGRNRFMCKVAGDSCWPALQPGDHVIWELDPAPPYGLIVLAERAEDQACTVKELARDRSGARLLPINPESAEPTAEGWSVRARLVGVIFNDEGGEVTVYSDAGIRPQHLLRLRS